MNKLVILLSAAMTFCSSGLAVAANQSEPLNLDELTAAFGWDMDRTAITTEKVTDNLYVLFGVGGNIGVSIGSDGVLIVDNQFPNMMSKIDAAVKKLGADNIDLAVNTHWHFDHAEGNLALGPRGTILVAHSNARANMAAGGIINLVQSKYRQQPYPEDALPILTYDSGMQLYYNDEIIDIRHFSPAHTTGDSAVIFRKQNAVHLGDVFNNSGYPFIDADSGGDIDGMIAFCAQTLAQMKPGATVIPGHGPITDLKALEDYIKMLETIRGRVSKMMDEGMTMEEVVAAKITQDYDGRYGDESASLGFVNRVYTSLKKKR